MTRQVITAFATRAEPPAASSANEAIASKPRYERTATETAARTAVIEKEPSPVSGTAQPRWEPCAISSHSAATTKTTSTTISRASTAAPTMAAARTPHRFSSVVTTTATAVHTHWCTDGTRACMAIPEKR